MGRVSNKKEKISIIIPVYNVEKYLNRCIDSLINQTYSNLEIILINDGSTDSSLKICEEYVQKDSRIKVINKKNEGVSIARNVGIEKATGQFISFVDSDDWIEHDTILKLYNLSQKYNSDYVMIDYIETDGTKKYINKKSNDSCIKKEEFMKLFFKIGSQKCVFYPWGKLIKRDNIPKDLFPSDCRIGEDVIANYKILTKTKKIVVSSEILYNYFQNNSGLTKSGFSDKDFDLINVWEQMLELTKNTEYYEYAKLNRYRTDFTILTRMALSMPYNDIIKKYGFQQKKMLESLKLNKKVLCKSLIPFTRKIMIQLICWNYKMFCKCIYLIKREK